MVNENLCPVCGYEMEDPPVDFNTCASCGTEFGLHDLNASVLELREAWIKTGPQWWSASDAKPEGWDPYTQLARVSAPCSSELTPGVVVRIVTGTTNDKIPVTDWARNRWGAEAWDQSANKQPA